MSSATSSRAPCSARRGRIRGAVVAVLMAAALCAVPHAGAQPDPAVRASARKLGHEGQDLFEAGDYAAALERYERASQLVDVPTLHVRVARCLERLGRLVAAAERYRQVIRKDVPADASPVLKQAIVDAKAELAAVATRIPWLLIRVEGPTAGLSLLIDDRQLPVELLGERIALDPGVHNVVVRRADVTRSATPALVEGETNELTLSLPPLPPPPPPAPLPPTPLPAVTPQPVLSAVPPMPTTLRPDNDLGHNYAPVVGWTVAGVGGALLVSGAVVGGLAVAKQGDLEADCGSALACPPSLHDDVDSYNGMRVATTVLLLGGAGLTAAGLAIALVGAGDNDDALALQLAPGRVGLRGTF